MGFWQDASPAVKGAVVLGALLIVYFAVAFFAGLPPYGSAVGEIQQSRGVQAE